LISAEAEAEAEAAVMLDGRLSEPTMSSVDPVPGRTDLVRGRQS